MATPGGCGVTWSSPVYQAVGHRFRVKIRSSRADAVLADEVVDVLGALSTSRVPSPATEVLDYEVIGGEHPGGPFQLVIDGTSAGEYATRSAALDFLLWQANQHVTRRSISAWTLLHAAAVSRGTGAVLLPAAMESGKTTTTIGLVQAGFDYLTDETVALDPDTLTVTPYPKPLTVDPGAQSLFPHLAPGDGDDDDGSSSWHVPADRIRTGAVATRVTSPVAVVMPAYQHAAVTRLERLSPAEAVTELTTCTFAFAQHGHRNLGVLARLVRRCGVHRLVIGSLAEAVDLVDALVSATTAGQAARG